MKHSGICQSTETSSRHKFGNWKLLHSSWIPDYMLHNDSGKKYRTLQIPTYKRMCFPHQNHQLLCVVQLSD